MDARRYEHAARSLDDTGRKVGAWRKTHRAQVKNAPCLTALPPFSCWRGHGQADQEPGVAALRALRALRWLRFERADIQQLRADMNTQSQQLREDMGQLRADNKYSRDY